MVHLKRSSGDRMNAAVSIISGLSAFPGLLGTLMSPVDASTLPAVTIGNSMPKHNFPDPSIIWAEGKWWAFGTPDIGSPIHFQLASSTDYVNWSLVTNPGGTQYDPMPTLGAWVDKGKKPAIWAPDPVRLDDGSYVVYYSALKAGTKGILCISTAKSKTIQGPYTALDDVMVCNGHAVFDAAGFKDWEVKGDWGRPSGTQVTRVGCSKEVNGKCGNSYADPLWSQGGYGGKRYIVYKIQNAGGTSKTPLVLQEVDAADGVTIKGSAKVLLHHEKGDDGSIEGPSLIKTPSGKYILTYSKGPTSTPKYTVSYAVADKITGPYKRKGNLLQTGDYKLNGPGGADLNWNGDRMLFHQMAQRVGQPYEHVRTLQVANIECDNTTGEITMMPLGVNAHS